MFWPTKRLTDSEKKALADIGKVLGERDHQLEQLTVQMTALLQRFGELATRVTVLEKQVGELLHRFGFPGH